jgi:hypothetical protein
MPAFAQAYQFHFLFLLLFPSVRLALLLPQVSQLERRRGELGVALDKDLAPKVTRMDRMRSTRTRAIMKGQRRAVLCLQK